MAQMTGQHGLSDKRHTIPSPKPHDAHSRYLHTDTQVQRRTAAVRRRSNCSMSLSRAFNPLALLCTSRGEAVNLSEFLRRSIRRSLW
jgi:hypothetical protein